MAKTQFGTIITGARGHVGGIVFSANRSGSYIKKRSTPSNPRTEPQITDRGNFNEFAINWSNLTQPQRDAWDVYADDPAQQKTDSLGNTFFASGFNWYIAINKALVSMGRASRDDPPVTGTPPQPTLDAVTITEAAPDAGTLEFPLNEFDGWDIVAKCWFAVGEGPSVLPQSRLRIVLREQNPGAVDQVVLTGVTAAFGDIQSGQKIFCQALRQSDQGRQGASAIVTGVTT